METWYVLEDGTAGDPRDIRRDADGRLRHKDGRAVAYASHGPRTRSVEAQAVEPLADPPKVGREMKAEQGAKGYRTRATKASE